MENWAEHWVISMTSRKLNVVGGSINYIVSYRMQVSSQYPGSEVPWTRVHSGSRRLQLTCRAGTRPSGDTQWTILHTWFQKYFVDDTAKVSDLRASLQHRLTWTCWVREGPWCWQASEAGRRVCHHAHQFDKISMRERLSCYLSDIWRLNLSDDEAVDALLKMVGYIWGESESPAKATHRLNAFRHSYAWSSTCIVVALHVQSRDGSVVDWIKWINALVDACVSSFPQCHHPDVSLSKVA
jgi:hypothetical protein